jgi:hypothetical protein
MPDGGGAQAAKVLVHVMGRGSAHGDRLEDAEPPLRGGVGPTAGAARIGRDEVAAQNRAHPRGRRSITPPPRARTRGAASESAPSHSPPTISALRLRVGHDASSRPMRTLPRLTIGPACIQGLLDDHAARSSVEPDQRTGIEAAWARLELGEDCRSHRSLGSARDRARGKPPTQSGAGRDVTRADPPRRARRGDAPTRTTQRRALGTTRFQVTPIGRDRWRRTIDYHPSRPISRGGRKQSAPCGHVSTSPCLRCSAATRGTAPDGRGGPRTS